MLGAEDQVIAHPPVFKIFDLAQIAVGFRDERRPARCLLMPALGQKRTSSQVRSMSALPPKADIAAAMSNVRFVPKADMESFDDLVGNLVAPYREEHVRFVPEADIPTSALRRALNDVHGDPPRQWPLYLNLPLNFVPNLAFDLLDQLWRGFDAVCFSRVR